MEGEVPEGTRQAAQAYGLSLCLEASSVTLSPFPQPRRNALRAGPFLCETTYQPVAIRLATEIELTVKTHRAAPDGHAPGTRAYGHHDRRQPPPGRGPTPLDATRAFAHGS